MRQSRSAEALDQGHGGGWRAQLALVDEIDEHVARLRLGFVARIDEGKIVRRAAFGPYTRTSGPLVQLLRRVGGGERIVASLQTCVDNIAGEIGHRRKILGLGVGTALVILAVLTVGFLIYMAIWGFTVTITEEQLQSALDENLPVTKSYELVEVTYDKAKVTLEEGSPRIDFQMEVDTKIGEALEQAVAEAEGFVYTIVDKILAEKGIEGSPNEANADQQDGEDNIEPINAIIHVSAEIGYDDNNFVLYLKQPRVEYVEVNETPLTIMDTVNTGLDILGIDLLDKIPVYSFSDNNIVSRLARTFLKDVKVENGEAKIDFAL